MDGAWVADYSGAQSKRTLSTTWHRVPGREGSGRANHFERNVQNVHPPITGSRHGKKTRSTPLGYTTTNALGNGNLRHGNFCDRPTRLSVTLSSRVQLDRASRLYRQKYL